MGDVYFDFKQFRIRHDRCAMKIGTDGVMLGAWCDAPGARRVLDIGTGTGVIALIVAQRAPEARIAGIEIDPEAAAQARENAMNSPWPGRIAIHCGDILSPPPALCGQSFDLIVSNPPFYENALDAADERRNCARNASSLPFAALIDAAKDLLHASGRFNVIVPFAAAEHFIYHCWERDLNLYRRTDIITKQGKRASRSMLGFAFSKQARREDALTIHRVDGSLTEEYKRLVQDFYVSGL